MTEQCPVCKRGELHTGEDGLLLGHYRMPGTNGWCPGSGGEPWRPSEWPPKIFEEERP